MGLPEFPGDALSIEPPFYFKNMVASVFPLRAEVDALQRFCDEYLNIIPEELGRFRASVPYVQLMLLDYGKLALQALNLGWFAQREVMFSVMVEWYKVVDGRWVFHDWASVAPFIYVDNPLSMSLGRTLLGWPKSLVNLTPELSGWMQDPGGATVDVAMSAKVLPRAYENARLVERNFLEIRSPMSSGLQVPLDASSPVLPWQIFSNAMKSMTDATVDYFGFLRGMGLLPVHAGTSADNFAQMGLKAAAMGNPWAPNLSANTLNLKQFPRADDPQNYCFQAITNGPMRFTAFNRGALLGERATWTGDPSGGYSIDLVGWPSFPIVDTLGLRAEVVGEVEGATISRLKPVFPFWYDVNMEYQRSSTVAWRTRDGQWRGPSGKPVAKASKPSAADLRYNTTLGAGSQIVTGPFEFDSAALRVLPLLAESAALQLLVDKTLNQPLESVQERFEVWGADDRAGGHAYVYLVATDWGPVSSLTNDIGDFAQMGLAFYVPVKRWKEDRLQGVGLFPAYTFADGTTQACTLAEIYGISTIEGFFTVPPTPFAACEPHSLLAVAAETLPSMGEGQQTRRNTVVEVRDRGSEGIAEACSLSDRAETFCRLLRREVIRKSAIGDLTKQAGRLSALGMLTQGSPLFVYTMKQFRDGGQPQRACYQALVRIPYVIDEVQQIEEIPSSVCVQIHEYPSLPITRVLGLVAREIEDGDGSRVHTVEAVRPFWMRAALFMRNGEELYYRTDETWQVGETPAPDTRHGRREGPGVALTAAVEKYVSTCRPCHVKSSVADWLEAQDVVSAKPQEAEAGARREWSHDADPQTVLESILSREWEDRSTTARRRKKRDQATRQFLRSEAGWGSWLDDNLMALRGDGLLETDKTQVQVLHRLERLLLVLDELRAAAPTVKLDLAWTHWKEAVQTRLFDRVFEVREAVLRRATPHFAPRTASAEKVEVLRKECSRCSAYEKDAFEESGNMRQQCRSTVEGLLQLLVPIAEWTLDRALDDAVAKGRKPDHCVLRSTAGLERDRLFPVEESWEETWWHHAAARETTR